MLTFIPDLFIESLVFLEIYLHQFLLFPELLVGWLTGENNLEQIEFSDHHKFMKEQKREIGSLLKEDNLKFIFFEFKINSKLH